MRKKSGVGVGVAVEIYWLGCGSLASASAEFVLQRSACCYVPEPPQTHVGNLRKASERMLYIIIYAVSK